MSNQNEHNDPGFAWADSIVPPKDLEGTDYNRYLAGALDDGQKDWPVYRELRNKYGKEAMIEWIASIARLRDDMSTLGGDKELLMSDSESEEYNSFVKRIVEKTQAYYLYVGNIPEDARRYLLERMNTEYFYENSSEEDLKSLFETISGNERANSFQAIRPKKYIMQIDAITNHLATLGEETRLRVGKRGNQPVLTTVTLDMPDHMKIEGGGQLTTYDKSIINGVTSLLESGNTVFSIPMLYHAMTGRHNPTVDDQLYEDISQKLEKMRRMMISIDLSEESEAQFITGESGERLSVSDVVVEGYLLPLNKMSGSINGKRTELFQIIQHPPLYTYSKMRRQLASVRISLLSAPVNNNATTIPLKTYLLQRIEMMKNTRNSITQSNILYESLYNELGASDAGKTKKMRIRTYTTTILNYFVEQEYIKAYEEYKSGRSVAGIRIEV